MCIIYPDSSAHLHGEHAAAVAPPQLRLVGLPHLAIKAWPHQVWACTSWAKHVPGRGRAAHVVCRSSGHDCAALHSPKVSRNAKARCIVRQCHSIILVAFLRKLASQAKPAQPSSARPPQQPPPSLHPITHLWGRSARPACARRRSGAARGGCSTPPGSWGRRYAPAGAAGAASRRRGLPSKQALACICMCRGGSSEPVRA